MRLFACVVFVLPVLMGCGGLFASQATGLSNFALLPNTQSDDPAWMDGDLTTAGAPVVEAYVVLEEPHVVEKVIVRSSEVMTCDLFVWDADAELWTRVGRQRNGPGRIKFDLDPPTRISSVRVEVLASTADAVIQWELWQEAYLQSYTDAFEQIESRSGQAYVKALARYGFRVPRPYMDPAEEADLQARHYAEDAVATAKRLDQLRAAAIIEEIEILGQTSRAE